MNVNATGDLSLFLSMLVPQLPMLLVSLAGMAVILARWNRAPQASGWALSGFGLALILCLVLPIMNTLIRHWLMQGGDHHTMGWMFSVVGFVSSLLHAISYGLVLVAVFVGRSPVRTNPMT